MKRRHVRVVRKSDGKVMSVPAESVDGMDGFKLYVEPKKVAKKVAKKVEKVVEVEGKG